MLLFNHLTRLGALRAPVLLQRGRQQISKQSFSTHSNNRYAIFRQSFKLHSIQNNESSNKESLNGYENAQNAVKLLAQKNRTWYRLSPIVTMAVQNLKNDQRGIASIADVGCDHGLLSIALAATGSFSQVIGSDVSHRALTDGALNFQQKVNDVLNREGIQQTLAVDFRVGDGMNCLNEGEVNGGICIAGMGVDTMLSILNFSTLDMLQCPFLYLQPPTSKPRRLMELYRPLQINGWELADEHISYVRNRWYITAAFKRSDANDCSELFRLPGHYLSQNDAEKEEFQRYVKFHLKWMNDDMKRGQLSQDEELWRSSYSTQ
jgi:tRNA A22 N-methylase